MIYPLSSIKNEIANSEPENHPNLDHTSSQFQYTNNILVVLKMLQNYNQNSVKKKKKKISIYTDLLSNKSIRTTLGILELNVRLVMNPVEVLMQAI